MAENEEFKGVIEELTRDHVEAVVEYLQELTQDRLVVESWYCETTFCGSTTARTGAPCGLPEFITGVMLITRRSWTGAQDAEMTGSDAGP